MSLKDKFREYMLLRSRDTKFRPNDYPGFDKIKTVAISFEAGENDRVVHDFANQFEKAGKKVSYLGYIPKKRKEIQNIPWFSHFTKDELNWFGKPKSDDVKAFLEPHYGVFICLNKNQEGPMEFISAAVGADFSIGLYPKPFTRFDLIVGKKGNSDIQSIFQEIQYYLNFINQPQKV